jgi:predicted transposase YbfD/YdcC
MGIMEHFSGIEDHRASNARRHDLHELLMIALCSSLCGGSTCVDMADYAENNEPFLREFLALKNGLPSHDTFSRLFRCLDPQMFAACFRGFMADFADAAEGVISIDGKTLRNSFDAASGRSPLHMVSAWSSENRLVLAQVATDEKSNEITAIPKLLALLSLEGATVTIDAMGTQRAIARQIVDQTGNYALALKGNQGTLHADVKLLMEDPERPETPFHRTVDADHGRIETRTATVETRIAFLNETHEWPGLAAVGKIVRQTETARKGETKTTTETSYYLLSDKLTPARFAEVVRAHWGIENRLHWVLDVAMDEDRARNRADNGSENLAILRHLTLNILNDDGTDIGMKRKFKKAASNPDYLRKRLVRN